MGVRTIEEPDVYVTKDENARFQADYQRDYSMFAGSPPTFESYVARRKRAAKATASESGAA